MTPSDVPSFIGVPTTIGHEQVSHLAEHDWAVWKAAHACLNAEPTGALSTDELEAAIHEQYPGHRFVRNTLQHNLSISPDFEQHYLEDTGRKVWCLTGSEIGVPKSLSRSARESLKRAQAQTALANAASPPNSSLSAMGSRRTLPQEQVLTPPTIPMHSRPSLSVRGTAREAPQIPRYSSRPYHHQTNSQLNGGNNNAWNHSQGTPPMTTAVELPWRCVGSLTELRIGPLSALGAEPTSSDPRPESADRISEGQCAVDIPSTSVPTDPFDGSLGSTRVPHFSSTAAQLRSIEDAFECTSNASERRQEEAPPQGNIPPPTRNSSQNYTVPAAPILQECNLCETVPAGQQFVECTVCKRFNGDPFLLVRQIRYMTNSKYLIPRNAFSASIVLMIEQPASLIKQTWDLTTSSDE
ncbi:hypothetical protein M407DRAFT_32960 [Tulasnella calospora MUT 4182]|uniref:Uncharacterized protein n=1 Tax=Tulasnella calospora MUT 4182 TaxID=1051891 RepID=A0A0C3PRV1_9AGAM|nr:hypothetical protein M407DRAFT_32960 [Tulasnella calospora MUT 4182]